MMNRCAFECGEIGDLKDEMSVSTFESNTQSLRLLHPFHLDRELIVLTAASAQSVRFVVALSKRARSFRCICVLAR